MTAKELRINVLYPVIVAITLGALATAGNLWVTQKLILAAIEDLRGDLDRVYSIVDDHVREGH